MTSAAATTLTVLSVSPMPFEQEVDVHTAIHITLSIDINPRSIISGFRILEDVNWDYDDKTSDLAGYPIVKGAASYDKRRITFTPAEPLKADCRYVIRLNSGGLTSVENQALQTTYVASFITTSNPSLPKAVFTSPENGHVCSVLPTIQWMDQQATAYFFELSRAMTFETMVYHAYVQREDGTLYAMSSHTPDVALADGLYFARVRAQNGQYSDPIQLNVQHHSNHLVSQEDFDENIFLTDFLGTEALDVDVLGVYPKDGATGTSLTQALLYVKLQGHVTEDKVDWDALSVIGSSIDEEDDEALSHGEVEGSWVLVYDETNHVTYAIFEMTTDDEPV